MVMSNAYSHSFVANVDGLGKLQIRLAMLFMLASAAPALYLSPIILLLIIYIACIQISVLLASGHHGYLSYPKYSLFALLIFVYCISSAMLTGLEMGEIFSYESVRYDANIIYSFLPFFVISRTTVTLIEVDHWIRAISLLAPVGFVTATAVGFPLFESHNAAGGYFMVLLAYVLGRVVEEGIRGWRMPLILLVFVLIESDSRGSLFAILTVLTMYKSFARFPRTSRLVLVLSVVGGIAFMVYAYNLWLYNGSVYLYDYSGFDSASAGLDFDSLLVGERPGTFLHRLFFLYPMAVDMFLNSPLLGVGFTRFDDYPQQFSNTIPFLSFNVSNSVLHTNFHAHNSYLHVLAELGLVGIALFGLLIRKIFVTFRRDRLTGIPAKFMLGALLLASFTEHRFTTPSQAAPVFFMIGILWACSKSRRT